MASQIVEEYGDERAAEAFKNGHEQGIAEGAQQKAVETAIKMLRNEVSVNSSLNYSPHSPRILKGVISMFQGSSLFQSSAV